jgi:hypothetical protein
MTCKSCGTGKKGLIACACYKCDWEQFPPIEGNPSDPLGTIAAIAAALFAVGMFVYVVML